MNSALKRLTGFGHAHPAPALVFLSAAALALLQIPNSLVIHYVNLSLGIVLNEVVIVLGVPLLLTWALHFDAHKIYPLAPPRARAWPAIIVMLLGTVIIIDYLTFASEIVVPLPARYQDALDRIMAVSSVPQYAYKFVLLCIMPGICEEVFFRGFCQTSLKSYKGDAFAIIATGALFALLHANPWHVHLYFVLGCFLSWVFYVSRSLWVPIVCHILNNAWTFTNNALDTAPPIEGASLPINALVLAGAIALALAGGSWFVRSNR